MLLPSAKVRFSTRGLPVVGCWAGRVTSCCTSLQVQLIKCNQPHSTGSINEQEASHSCLSVNHHCITHFQFLRAVSPTNLPPPLQRSPLLPGLHSHDWLPFR
ncbi:hypothetical protein ATANTOWER_016570 [Ataeniobius toweri]|uniref:Uncharacterized protein n=1 Tax=Ataeniobius toweri TaxID=208326 RepID=A0ABU7C9U9_9TELE|nr:hypothetical protein [Ataeniobius toweri]